jgi:DNA repair proteins
MKTGDRVKLRGSKQTGIVKSLGGRDALIVWDDEVSFAPGRWIALDDLKLVEPKRYSNPPMIHAPEIQDLEFITRIDGKTQSLMMERDAQFRGGPGPVIETSDDIYRLWKGMSEKEQEHLVVGNMDVRQNLIGWRIAHVGKLDAVDVDPVEIIKFAIFAPLTDSIVILHNHPTGDPEPSEADKELTKAVEELADIHNRYLFDHVVVGRPSKKHPKGFFSFQDAGLIDERQID